MLRALIKTSLFVLLLKKIWKNYSFIENWLDRIYQESQAHRLIKEFCVSTKINFKYSFLEKITEIKEEENFAMVKSNLVIQWLIDLYKKWKFKIISYLNISTTYSFEEELKKEFNFFPIRTTSIVAVVAILTNTIYSLLFKKEIGLFGWIMRGLLLFIGFSGLFCNVDWKNLKETSFVLRYMDKRL